PWEEVPMPVIVLRHGERLDYVDPRWLGSAARPWDPPLTEEVRSLSLHDGFLPGRSLDNLHPDRARPWDCARVQRCGSCARSTRCRSRQCSCRLRCGAV
ncbi:MAG: hypothetical protein ACPIOQ_51160, partial [Promethearchaeia archaeon]